MISFKTDIPTQAVIQRIATRSREMGNPRDWSDICMDLMATHLNGCPLDLWGLLAATDFDFDHDIYGIQDHLDRSTGRLRGFFLPRYAKPAKAKRTRRKEAA